MKGERTTDAVEKIDKWIEAFNRAEFDCLGIMQMTKECKDMLVNDMEEWKNLLKKGR